MCINILLNEILKIFAGSYNVYSLCILDSHLLLYNNNKTGVESHVFGWLFTPVIYSSIEVFAPVFDEIFIKIIAAWFVKLLN